MGMSELFAVSLTAGGADVESEPGGLGSIGFYVVIGLIIVLVLLYLSLRKQLRRVDFDPNATNDQERIASHHEPGRRSDDQPDPGPDAKPDQNPDPKHDHPA